MELTVGKLVCYFQKITDMNSLPLDYSSPHNIGSAKSWSIHTTRRNLPIMGYKPNHVTIKPADNSIVCLTQPCSTLRNYIQNWLHVSRRAGNDAQDLTRGGLLLQCFGKVTVAYLQLLE